MESEGELEDKVTLGIEKFNFSSNKTNIISFID
jgi:hypothetical protein